MSKIFDKKNKKNISFVKKQLEKHTIMISDSVNFPKKMTGAEALILGFDFLNRQRKYSAALSIADQMLPMFSKVIDVWILKLRALVKLEKISEALALSDKLLKDASTNLGILITSAELMLIFNHVERAYSLLKKAQSLEEKNIAVNNALAIYFSQIGEKRKAIKYYKKAYESGLRPRSHESDCEVNASNINTVLGLGDLNGWNSEMESLVEKYYLVVDDLNLRGKLALGLAKYAAKNSDLQREVDFLKVGNQHMRDDLRRHGSEWCGDRVARLAQLNRNIFSLPLSGDLSEYKSQYIEKPIFILGMPRSGTTLLEQMLGSHSLIGQTGESKGFPRALENATQRLDRKEFKFPEQIPLFDSFQLDNIAHDYIEHQKFYTEKNTFVDKNLASYKYVGLAALLFPNAQFIHIARHPLDIFLSCYRSGIPGVPATCSIEHMAYEYIEMKKLIGFWKNRFPKNVCVIEYKNLVQNAKSTMSTLFEFLGLDWEEGVLAFSQRKNTVRTLSLHQVRKGLYTTSINKWRPYREMFEPAIAILKESGYLDANLEMTDKLQ